MESRDRWSRLFLVRHQITLSCTCKGMGVPQTALKELKRRIGKNFQVSENGRERLKTLALSFVQQIAADAIELAQKRNRKTVALQDILEACATLIQAYWWIDRAEYMSRVLGVQRYDGSKQIDPTLFYETKPNGKRKVRTLGTLMVKEVQGLLKTSRNAPRDVNAFACRAADIFVFYVLESATQSGSVIDTADIDRALTRPAY